MKICEQFPSRYLKAIDLTGRPTRLEIGGVEKEEIGIPPEPTLILHFKGSEKTLPLNKTNATMIAQLFGDETADWAGRFVRNPSHIPGKNNSRNSHSAGFR